MGYREYLPSARLSPMVECLWTYKSEHYLEKIIVPDGCMDLLIRLGKELPRIEVVGVMSRSQIHRARPGITLIGVRFRPGMASAVLKVAAPLLTDRVLPLDHFWRNRAEKMAQTISAANTMEERIDLLERSLPADTKDSKAQQAIDLMTARCGQVSSEELGDVTKMSQRQFQRSCRERTGLSPKRLSRVLRFRRASQLLAQASPPSLVEVAAACGYYDQSHLNLDFRAIAGLAPTQYQAMA